MKRYLFLFLILLAGDSLAGEIKVSTLNRIKWSVVETENFYVMTDAGEKKGKAMAEQLENFMYFFTSLLGYKQVPLPQKVPVFLAKSPSSFKRFGFRKGYSGIFVKRGSDVAIFANVSGFSPGKKGQANQARQTILHELVHLITFNIDLPVANPIWHAEGIAEYFATYKETRDNILLGDMSLVQYRFASLARPGKRLESIDVESLLKARSTGMKDEYSRSEQREVSKFYARSFALVHYLHADPERRKKLNQYLFALKKGFGIDESFEAIFETDYATMTAEVDEYIKGKFVYGRVFNRGENGIEFPKVKYNVRTISKRKALEVLVPKLGLIPPPFIASDDIQNMYDDVEALYPDFFEQ